MMAVSAFPVKSALSAGGDSDFSSNISHLVLARLPDSPNGTAGLTMFFVPKVLPNGDANDLEVVSLEEKLGLHGSPTAVMRFVGARGWIVGQPNLGMRAMFTMMNNARLGVGTQGVGIAEAAFQQALDYALLRKQGKTGIGIRDRHNFRSRRRATHVAGNASQNFCCPRDLRILRNARERGIEDGDLVRLFNDQGETFCYAVVIEGLLDGVCATQKQFKGSNTPSGINVNVLNTEMLTDFGESPTFYSCLAEIEKANDEAVRKARLDELGGAEGYIAAWRNKNRDADVTDEQILEYAKQEHPGVFN